MRAEHDMATAGAPPRLRQVLLCLLLALAMLASFCLPNPSALGFGGVETAWAAEEGEDDPGETTEVEKAVATEKPESDLKKDQTCSIPKANVTEHYSDTNPKWFAKGHTFLYIINNGDAPQYPDKGVQYGTTKVKCSGWAKYRLDFTLLDVTEGSGGVAIYNGTKLNTRSAVDDYEETRHTVGVELSLVDSKGVIGTLALDKDSMEVKMRADWGTSDNNHNMAIITPIKMSYKMPTKEQCIYRAKSNNGDNNINGYAGLVDEDGSGETASSSKGYTSHRMSLQYDLGGQNNTRGFSPLNMTQEAADSNGKITLYSSIHAASAGMRTSYIWNGRGADKTKVKYYNLNRDCWQMVSTAPVKEQICFDLNGGTTGESNIPASSSIYRNGTNAAGKALNGSGRTLVNGTKVMPKNPTKKGYVFAGWEWVKPESGCDKISGKDTYATTKKYAAQAPEKTLCTTQAIADKYVLDTATIEGRVYDSSAATSTNAKKALDANKATPQSTITLQNGFNGTKFGPDNGRAAVHKRGIARTTFKARWVQARTVTYYVDGSMVDQYVVDVGKSLGEAKKTPSQLGAKYGWWDNSKYSGSKVTPPDTMPDKSLVYYGHNDNEPDPPSADEAKINYYVDGKLCTTYTVKFDEQYGTKDGTNVGQVGVIQNGITSFPTNSVRQYNNDAMWYPTSQTLKATYQQATDVPVPCIHGPYECPHLCPDWDCDDEGCWPTTYYCPDQKWTHGGCSTQGNDTRYQFTSSDNPVPQSAVSPPTHGAPNDMGHTDSVCGTDKWYKWYLNDEDCTSTPYDQDSKGFSIVAGQTYDLYSYTLHKVTYTVNPAKDPNSGSTVYTGTIKSGKTYEKNYTHWEKWDSVENPEEITEGNGQCSTMHTGTGNSNPTGKCFNPSELPQPKEGFYGWYTDPECQNDASAGIVGKTPTADPTSHLHFYSYTTHEIKYILNPGGENVEILSEEVRLGQSCEEFSEAALADVEAGLDPERDKTYSFGWSDTGSAIDFNRGGENADGKEGAEPNVVYSIVTYHEGHLITDVTTDAEKDWMYSELFPGAERFPMKQGVDYDTPTYGNTSSHYTSNKITLPNCEIWDSHVVEDGLVPDTWFSDSNYNSATTKITGNSDATVYTYNANFLTLDFTTYAKSLDKDMEGKYQLFMEKVEKKTENSAAKLKINGVNGLCAYLENTIYEKCGNCSHTEHSTLYQGGSQQIGNHHFYKYGDEAPIPQLPACYWLNDSKLNNDGYNEGDQLLSRNARNPEGGAYLTPDASRTDMVGTSYTVRGNTVLYMDYVQGLYDGVITG